MNGRSLFRIGQHVERSLVARAQAHLPVQPRHGFGVVVQNVGMRIHDDLHGRVRALKIGHQHFHFAARNALANRRDREREQFRPAVFAVVAIDAGDHGILQPQHSASLRHAPRLVVIDRQRRALLHGAESAAARADIAQDHEGGRAPVPAFADVRTGRALANRM